jgi:hypothetical protein
MRRLLIASLFAMAALGMLILIEITDFSRLVAPTNSPAGMNPRVGKARIRGRLGADLLPRAAFRRRGLSKNRL